jgi:polyhydroxyalkanoate synthesis regulator phasin
MADIRDGFKDIFLAGVGALAYGGERANELVNNLIEKGELTVEQGKQLNTELQHKASDTIAQVRDEALAAQLQAMTPEQRAEFVAKVNELANKVTDDAAAAAVSGKAQ